MTRREMLMDGLRFGSALLVSGQLRALQPQNKNNGAGLRALATAANVKLGFQASRANLEVVEFAQFMTRNFSVLTPGNEFKWPRVHPNPESYFFGDTDWLVAFCEKNNMLVHGHNLCWNSPSANPSWFPSILTRANAAKQLTDHITTVMTRYRG